MVCGAPRLLWRVICMVARSAFEVPISVSEGNAPVAGKTYTVELEDLLLYEKVVAYTPFNDSLRMPDGTKVLGKEYDSLPPDIRAAIDNAPEEHFINKDGSEGNVRRKFVNRLTFVFKEPISGWSFYTSIDLSYPENTVDSQKAKKWLTKVLGMPISTEDGFKWGDLFKKGDKFTALVGTDSSGRRVLMQDSIVKVGAGNINVVSGGQSVLSPDARALLEFIKQNMVGRKFGDIVDMFASGANGTIQSDNPEEVYERTRRAWVEIRTSGVKYSLDGTTFGF